MFTEFDSAGKESACKAGDTGDSGSIPGSERSPGGGNGNPLQYSCLKNHADSVAWWVKTQRSQRVGRDWATKHTQVVLPLPRGFPGASVIKNPPANAGNAGSITELRRSPEGWNGNPLKHSCLENPRGAWTEELVGVQSMGSQRVGHDWALNTHIHRYIRPAD